MSEYQHIPVMLNEVIELLNIKKGGTYFDGTLGGASYAREISKRIGERGRLVVSDLDPMAINNFLKDAPSNTIVINDNFANLEDHLDSGIPPEFDGMVLDLGLSSAQLDDPERGFSFRRSAPLDMSFGPQSESDTYFIVNNYKQENLERIIREYGEEPWAKKIAKNIIEQRRRKKIETVDELVEIICSTIPKKFWSRKIHPATKTFQALRMETNKELENLQKFLSISIPLLKKGGRLAIVSFHSLEDRMAKNFFRNLSREEKPLIKILTPKPLIPSEAELEKNHRSRSAKLRVIEKIV